MNETEGQKEEEEKNHDSIWNWFSLSLNVCLFSVVMMGDEMNVDD